MKKRIKRITAVAAAAALAISFTFPAELGLADLGVGGNAIVASAESSGNCGDSGSNVTWSLDDNGTLTISGSGKIEDCRSDIDQPWYSNRSDITSVVIEPGVTSIGSQAFYECSNLTSITIPSGLTSIGEQAFGNCTGLTSITIPSGFISIGDYAFWNCTGLTSITIQNGVTSIGTGAFWNCTGLTSITIPSSVTSIGVNVFYNCTGLTDITVDSNNSSFCSESGVLFNKDKTTLIYYPLGKNDSSYTIPDGVTVIEQYAFYCNSKLTSVTIPSGVTSIGEMAFRECSGLTSVIVPSSVTSIEYNAFWCCFNLIIYIPGGITIGIDAFYSTAAKITYTVDSSNNVKITDISLSSGNTVDIPATIDGKTVIAVDEDHRHKVGNHTCVTNTTPTCIKKATCGICGQDYYGDHDLSHHNAVPHTCTADGTVEYWDCSVCGKKFSDPNGTAEITNIADPNDPARHSLVKTDEKAPTCTDNGNRAYWTCTECKNIFSDDAGLNPTTLADVTVFATGHTWSNDWSSDGTGHWHDCVNANCPITENNQKVGYAVHTPGADATETTPQTCDVCGYVINPELGHIHQNHLTFVTEVPETCTTDGVKAHYECSCGKLFADDQAVTEVTLENLKIAAHHSYRENWESDNDDNHYHVCSVCNDKKDITAHSYDNGVITTPATEEAEGEKIYTCSVCHHIKTETVPKLSHTHRLSEDYSMDETGHWHACSGCDKKVDFEAHTENSDTVTIQPTATTAGVRVYSCSVCGYGIRTEIIPATGGNVISTPSVFTENLTVNAEESGSTVILSWDMVKNADKYYVYQYKDRKYVKIKTTADNSVEINGLKNGGTYKFLVRYTIGGKLSPMTYSYKITVKVYYKPVIKAASTENSVRLTWEAVPNAEKYAVYKYVDGKAVKLCETEKLAVRINKLSPDNEYKYIVRAYVDGKWTVMMTSDIVTIKTKAE